MRQKKLKYHLKKKKDTNLNIEAKLKYQTERKIYKYQIEHLREI